MTSLHLGQDWVQNCFYFHIRNSGRKRSIFQKRIISEIDTFWNISMGRTTIHKSLGLWVWVQLCYINHLHLWYLFNMGLNHFTLTYDSITTLLHSPLHNNFLSILWPSLRSLGAMNLCLLLHSTIPSFTNLALILVVKKIDTL